MTTRAAGVRAQPYPAGINSHVRKGRIDVDLENLEEIERTLGQSIRDVKGRISRVSRGAANVFSDRLLALTGF